MKNPFSELTVAETGLALFFVEHPTAFEFFYVLVDYLSELADKLDEPVSFPSGRPTERSISE